MSFPVRIHEAAEVELNEAADFYELESSGLGRTFLDEIERAIARIREFPDASPIAGGDIRKCVLATFPFSVLYSVRTDEIRILAVAHHHRHPFYWRGRK